MRDLLDQATVLTGHIGSSDFERALFEFAFVNLPVNKCTAYFFPTCGAPSCIIAAGRNVRFDALAHSLSKHYIAEDYANDPNLDFLSCPVDGHVHTALIDACRIAEGSFRKRYYEIPRITQEVAFRIVRSEGAYYLSLFRGEEHDYLRDRQVNAIEQGGKLMLAAIMKHAEMTGVSQRSADHRPLDLSSKEGLIEILLDCPGRLSRREAEICSYILLGYSTLAMSINLGVAVNTIATHRKRAYCKLNMSSQSELFRLVIKGMQRRVEKGTSSHHRTLSPRRGIVEPTGAA